MIRKLGASFVRRSVATLGACAMFAMTSPASAQFGPPDRGYVGHSFLRIADVSGDWRGANHRNWVTVNGHYWVVPVRPRAPAPQQDQARAAAARPAQQAAAGPSLRVDPIVRLPAAPASGAGTLVLAIDKNSPALAAIMERCRSGAVMDEMRYAVSAERSRTRTELGRLPADVPVFIEYNLRNLRFEACPLAEGAPEQAIVVRFEDIEWLNWNSEVTSVPVTLEPAALRPLPRNLTGETRAWVLTWFALAHDVSDTQCPAMNERPAVETYYRYLSPDEAQRERAALEGQGGPDYENGQMGLRGPGRLNVTLLPGIVPDPGHAEPQTLTARGVNLDGGARARDGRRNYMSEDGALSGIDNQLYTVMGCVAGWQGHRGFSYQFANNQMRDGAMSMLVEIAGIDDAQNDREVYVTWRLSFDPMVKSGSGGEVLSNYTYRVTDRPAFSHYFSRVRGRIVDGVVVTEPVDEFRFNTGFYGSPPELELAQVRQRITLMPDGAIRGVIGGYRDWREISSKFSSSQSEFIQGFQQPALYNSLRRNADGMRNPVTGGYDGISAAYDIEGIPAFVIDTPPAIAQASGASGGGS